LKGGGQDKILGDQTGLKTRGELKKGKQSNLGEKSLLANLSGKTRRKKGKTVAVSEGKETKTAGKF